LLRLPIQIREILDPNHHVRQIIPEDEAVYGIFATKDIAAEVPVVEYSGIIKTHEELKKDTNPDFGKLNTNVDLFKALNW
jgi:hypothetical protein